MRILIIEDDIDISRQLSSYLEQCRFLTHVERSGIEGHYQGDTEDYDLVLLDAGLPDMDGFQILEQWRRNKRNMPVILLTARTHKMDVIRGLNAGADDYIKKPYDLEEVVARIRANISRHKGQRETILKCAEVTFDRIAGTVSVNGAYISLTRIEYLLLEYLFLNRGKTVSVTQLSECAYHDFDRDSKIIPRHISNIRKKIGEGVILTESNRGYYVPGS